MKKKVKFITMSAMIAAIYTVLTLINPFSFGQIQVRISEILTVLPFFTFAAVPGLTVGCIVSNFIAGNGPVDVILGSFATLLAAYLTYKIPKKILAPLPPVVINAVIVGAMLTYVYKLPLPLPLSILSVGAGQFIACYILGYPFMAVVDKLKHRLFE